MEEWPGHKTSIGPRAAAENASRKEIPMFLAIRAIRPGSSQAIREDSSQAIKAPADC
jgi:hypothetical protein